VNSTLPGRTAARRRPPARRIRANELQVIAADGETALYLAAAHLQGRAQRAGVVRRVLQPEFAARTIRVGELRLVLHPDASRSLIDAWDDLVALAGWALALLGLLFAATRKALDAALRPLGQVMQALDRTGSGRFDTRLPVFRDGRNSAACHVPFNGMADRLKAAVDDNVRLETEHEVAHRMQARLEGERRLIARELHDELAQGITAVRALAGAIAQRTAEQPALHSPAQSIVAVTGEMQEGVKAILHRLRAAGRCRPRQHAGTPARRLAPAT
jgi:two-component system sensor histidine kinase UhpB